jgi:hypothetical protein
MKKKITQIGMTVCMLIACTANGQNGLFISEVADPGDEYTGRFIELFNAGSETVDFSSDVFYLTRQSNGGTTWGTVQLTGTVGPGRTYVIGGSAFESLYGFAPDLLTGILTGNGDDPYSLYSGGDHETGLLHDIYGETNTDGTGEPWEYTDCRAVRVQDVDDPRILWSASEWIIEPAGVADCDPGTHHGSGGGGPIIPEGDFALAVVSDTVEEGQLFYAAVDVSEILLEDNVISFQFDVDYDPDMLSYIGSTVSGTLADGGTLAENNATAGSVSVSYMHTDPLSGSGHLLLLQFEPLALGTSGISLSNAYINNLSVPEVYSGTIRVAETSPPTARVTYSDTVNRLSDMLQITAVFSEVMDAANPLYLHMTGAVIENNLEMIRLSDTSYSYLYFIPHGDGEVQVSLSNGTDMNGNEVVSTPVSGGTFTIIGLTPGDVNDDGAIQAYDAALALQHSVGLDPLPDIDPLPWEAWRDSTANVDRSGTITAYDAGLILQHSAGIISVFPSEAKKSLEITEVWSEVEDGHLVIRSGADLIGLNLVAESPAGLLGTPRLVRDDFLSAYNIDGSTYRIGICTAEPPPDGAELLRIPIIEQGTLLLQMNINGEDRNALISVSTRIAPGEATGLKVYPNPVRDRLMIEGLDDGVVEEILFFDANGRVVRRIEPQSLSSGVDVSDLEPGLYFLRIIGTGAVMNRKIFKN